MIQCLVNRALEDPPSSHMRWTKEKLQTIGLMYFNRFKSVFGLLTHFSWQSFFGWRLGLAVVHTPCITSWRGVHTSHYPTLPAYTVNVSTICRGCWFYELKPHGRRGHIDVPSAAILKLWELWVLSALTHRSNWDPWICAADFGQ